MFDSLGRNKPRVGDPFMYLKTLLIAWWWCIFGDWTNWLRNWSAKFISGLV